MSKKAAVFSLIVIVLCLFAITSSASAEPFSDDFSDTDYIGNGWYVNVLIGNPNANYIFPERKRLSLHMPDYNTTLYMINKYTAAGDSKVEAVFENVFSSNSQYGVVCRYHDYGWYELRIIVSGANAGSYAVYKYDRYLKSQGKNPYVIIHPGMDRYFTNDIKLGLNVTNKLGMICEGDEIRVFINDIEQYPIRNGKLTDRSYSDGENGFVIWTQTPGGTAQIDVVNFNVE